MCSPAGWRKTPSPSDLMNSVKMNVLSLICSELRCFKILEMWSNICDLQTCLSCFIKLMTIFERQSYCCASSVSPTGRRDYVKIAWFLMPPQWTRLKSYFFKTKMPSDGWFRCDCIIQYPTKKSSDPYVWWIWIVKVKIGVGLPTIWSPNIFAGLWCVPAALARDLVQYAGSFLVLSAYSCDDMRSTCMSPSSFSNKYQYPLKKAHL